MWITRLGLQPHSENRRRDRSRPPEYLVLGPFERAGRGAALFRAAWGGLAASRTHDRHGRLAPAAGIFGHHLLFLLRSRPAMADPLERHREPFDRRSLLGH